MRVEMSPGKISAFGFVSGFLLLATAGILAFTGDSKAANIQFLERRLQQTYNQFGGPNYGTQARTGLSGTPSDYSATSSGSKSLDHKSFGGNHYFTLAPLGAAGGEFVIYIVAGFFCCIYAFLYYEQVVKQIRPLPKQPDQGRDDFEPGICQCFVEACMCFHLICPCCVYVRQAHTNAVTGICGFWETFFAYLVTGMCCMIGPCCLTVFFRMRLKEHMGIEDHPINDLCLAWLCSPCAVGQQALAVDEKLGYEVEMCCALKWLEEDRDEEGNTYDTYATEQPYRREQQRPMDFRNSYS